MKKEYIKKEAWTKMLNFLKNTKAIYIVSEEQCKQFVEAIFWMARTGAQWRELPENYGLWNSVYRRFNTWSKKNVWNGLFAFCVQDPDLEYLMIDTTIVRAHPCSSGYGQGLGRSKGGFTTKIHVKVDALGNPLKFIITAGQRGDITQAEELVGMTSNSYVLADRAYDSDTLRTKLNNQNCIPIIPGKSNRKTPIFYDKHIYKERHLVECFFSKIKNFRRIFSRFDKSLRNFNAFLSFVGALVWLR